MEVVDSHMDSHISPYVPSSHADIDMSGDYDDEEYIMHDAHLTNDTVTDEEIYDAEIEEQTGHTEVEMDDYTDELADDNETNMGILADDATVTDVTVEDVHLPSSPVASGSPRGSFHHAISPREALGADLPISEAAPVDSLSNHSPQSVVTLVDDSELHPSDERNEKTAPPLLEVIDLTNNDGSIPSTTISSADEPTATYEGAQGTSGAVEEEQYEEDSTPTVTDSPVLDLSVINQSTEETEEISNPLVVDEGSANAVTTLHEAESAEQYDDEGHSPIEEALVLNQQVRDDAADSMEPSPPVRLTFDDKLSGVLKTYDLFSRYDPSSSEPVEVLFDDNRTLFYDPLSVFFTRLRETDHFSGEDWKDAEMGLSVNLGNYDLSISEDHKQTDDISLFKLLFISTGLGIEGPLRLSLQRYPTRFSVRYALLIDQLEQRDLHSFRGEEELHEVQDEHEAGEVEYEGDQYTGDDAHTAEHEDEGIVYSGVTNETPTENHVAGGVHSPGGDARAHEEHEEDQDAHTPIVGQQAEVAEHTETDGVEGEDVPAADAKGFPDDTENVNEPDVNVLPQLDHAQLSPSSPPQSENKQANGDPVSNANLYDNAEYTEDGEIDMPGRQGEQPHTNEFEEYEVEEENPVPSEKPNGTSTSEWEGRTEDEYDYEEDYGAEDDANTAEHEQSTEDALNYDEASSTSEAVVNAHSPAPNSRLKRNIDDLEHEKYETPSAPSSPSSDHKRAKRT